MKLPRVTLKQQFIEFNGGLDTVTPHWTIRPGVCVDAQNFEQDPNKGYSFSGNYERFDGQDAPSDGIYSKLTTSITGVSLGDVLTDGAALGTVIALVTGATILTKVTGTFATGAVDVGGVPKGTCVGPQTADGEADSDLHAQYTNLAADEYRDDIAAVPGSGDVLGLSYYNSVWYALRNNAGGTAAALYKSSAAGWALVALGRELTFTSGGTYEVVEGNTIEGEIGGATAVITRVVLESGTWAGGDAAGRFIFASQTGTFQAETVKVGASLDVASIPSDSSAITFAVPTGRMRTIVTSFTGSTELRMYGCDGKNRGFEFDGTVFAPIETGMTVDTPVHIREHKGHLFFSFQGSAQHSAPGFPYVWSVVVGAGELAIGDEITGYVRLSGSETGAALGIMSRNSIHILYGTSVSDWNLVSYNEEAGAYADSVQTVGTVFMFDDRGMTTLKSTQSFGNFYDAAISNHIKSWLSTKVVIDSCISREKNQYRLFFTDSTALYVTVNKGKPTAIMPQAFADEVTCVHSAETTAGTEVICFGGNDGMVYQVEKGTSHDGDEVERFIELSYVHLGSPVVMKRFRLGVLELNGTGYAKFNFGYNLGYSSTNISQPNDVSETSELSGGVWDTGTWDVGVWDGRSLAPAHISMTGTGENIAMRIESTSEYYDSIKFSGIMLQYSLGRGIR